MGAVSAAAAVVGLVASTLPAAGAPAFEPGQANAQAYGMVIDPRSGNLSIGLRFAESLADYLGSVGRGQAAGLDLGVIGTTLAAPDCNGKVTLPADQQPQAVHVDSRDPNASQGTTRSLVGTPAGGPLFAGASSGSARASSQPLGWSHATAAGLSLGPGISVGGGDTTTQAQILGGNTRDASAEANLSTISLAGGLVVLKGLHWDADQRTSSSAPVYSGTFTLGGVTIAGLALPTVGPGVLQSTINLANTALAPIGLRIDLPAVKHEGDGTVGHVAVTPLTIGIYSSSLGSSVLGPILNSLHALREQLFQAMLKAYCPFGTEITILDVLLSSLTGGGSLALEFGGVDVRTDGTVYQNPFGFGGGLDTQATVDTLPLAGSAGPPPSAGPSPDLPALPPTTSEPLVAPSMATPTVRSTAAPAAKRPARGAVPVVARALRHVGLWGGILGLSVAVGLAVADALWERRGHHQIPEEVTS